MVAPFFKEPRRRRRPARKREGDSARHLENIRKLPSCVSGRTPCEAHHLRIKDERGVGLKASDRWAVPLTTDEHVAGPDCVHSVGSRQETAWFRERGVDCLKLAAELWDARHSLAAMERVIAKHATWV
jgi:hypothetical protein